MYTLFLRFEIVQYTRYLCTGFFNHFLAQSGRFMGKIIYIEAKQYLWYND